MDRGTEAFLVAVGVMAAVIVAAMLVSAAIGAIGHLRERRR